MQLNSQKYVQTGEFKTAYYEGGQGNETVLLIHGGGAGADAYGNWRTCFPIFSEETKVFAIDMVGFGNSDAPNADQFEYTQQARIKQVIDFIEAMNLQSLNIVGNSMGGATGLGVAMQRPELIKSLTLMGSAGLNRQVNTALGKVVNYDFTLDGMRKIVEALGNPDMNMPEDLISYRHQLSNKPDVKQAYQATMGWIKSQGGLHYTDEEIAAVKNRTLVFNGKDDKVIPMQEGFHFLELLENSTGYFLPHCGHWAMMEYPELFSKVTLDFILNK